MRIMRCMGETCWALHFHTHSWNPERKLPCCFYDLPTLHAGCKPRYTVRDLPGGASTAASGRGRTVFSSSGIPTRLDGCNEQAVESSLSSTMVSGLSSLAASLFTILFPSDCRLCGEPLTNISRLPVCPQCLDAMRPLSGALCSVCGERLTSPAFVSAENEPMCGLCRRTEPPYIRAAAYGSYEGGLRELIHLLKYNGVRTAANVLGRMLAEAISHLTLREEQVLVIPVPLYARKLRQREFNQAELIARSALKHLQVVERFQLTTKVLERRRETQSQIGLSRHQRRENMRGAFVVSDPPAIKGKTVLLVDDVFTTGTTVSECARVLRRAGASNVYVATVARTLKFEVQGVRIEQPESEQEMAMAAHG